VISFMAIPNEAHQVCMVSSKKKINLRKDSCYDDVEICNLLYSFSWEDYREIWIPLL